MSEKPYANALEETRVRDLREAFDAAYNALTTPVASISSDEWAGRKDMMCPDDEDDRLDFNRSSWSAEVIASGPLGVRPEDSIVLTASAAASIRQVLMELLQAALAARPPVGQEPAAWKYRLRGTSRWWFSRHEPSDYTWEREPLYAAPPAHTVDNYEVQTESGPLACSLAVYSEWQKNEEYIERLKAELDAAIAARQPVGQEPVVYQGRGNFDGVAGNWHEISRAEYLHHTQFPIRAYEVRALYAAPAGGAK